MGENNDAFLARLDEISKPNKRLILALWQNHARVLSPEKRDTIRNLVQELYALSPEDAQKYFEQVNSLSSQVSAKKKLMKKWDKKLRDQKDLTEEERCYLKFQKLFIKGMQYACSHRMPPLVSPRVRTMSNVILGQLCSIRKVQVPERNCCAKQGLFLINLADWLAVIIEHLCYEIRASKILALEETRRAKNANSVPAMVQVASAKSVSQKGEGE